MRPLLDADRFRGPFIPLGDDEDPQAFARRMRARERRVPFRRLRPVWQVQLGSTRTPCLDDEPGAVVYLDGYSSLMRRARAIAEGKRVAAIGNWRVTVVDVGTGAVAFAGGSG